VWESENERIISVKKPVATEKSVERAINSQRAGALKLTAKKIPRAEESSTTPKKKNSEYVSAKK